MINENLDIQADISALERHMELERKSLEHRRRMLESYAKKKMDNLDIHCRVELLSKGGDKRTFSFSRINNEVDEYFHFYMYSDIHDADNMKKGMRILDEIIKSGHYPNGTICPGLDWQFSPYRIKS